MQTTNRFVSRRYAYRAATPDDLARIWDRNIADNPGDGRWTAWKQEYVAYNQTGKARTFVVLHNGEPVGEGTLLFSPECAAVGKRTQLADGSHTANVNALRIEKAHEGKGHISRLMRLMEHYAAAQGYKILTIGVEARETRNLAIYLHWGYGRFVMPAVEEGELVLYYARELI